MTVICDGVVRVERRGKTKAMKSPRPQSWQFRGSGPHLRPPPHVDINLIGPGHLDLPVRQLDNHYAFPRFKFVDGEPDTRVLRAIPGRQDLNVHVGQVADLAKPQPLWLGEPGQERLREQKHESLTRFEGVSVHVDPLSHRSGDIGARSSIRTTENFAGRRFSLQRPRHDPRLEREYLLCPLEPRSTLMLDVVDYPGEWLLDLALIESSYTAWSRATIRRQVNRADSSTTGAP